MRLCLNTIFTDLSDAVRDQENRGQYFFRSFISVMEEEFDRDNVDFLPPIMVEEKTSAQREGAASR